MFNNRKLWILIILSITNQELFGMEKPSKKSKRPEVDLKAILAEAERRTDQILAEAERRADAIIAAQEKARAEQEKARAAAQLPLSAASAPTAPQQAQAAQPDERLAELSAQDLLEMQNFFTGMSSQLPLDKRLERLTAQDVLRLQQKQQEAMEVAKKEAARKVARTFYDDAHRQTFMQKMRKEVVNNTGMTERQKIEELRRDFDFLVKTAERMSTKEVLVRKITEDRRVLVDEIYRFEAEKREQEDKTYRQRLTEQRAQEQRKQEEAQKAAAEKERRDAERLAAAAIAKKKQDKQERTAGAASASAASGSVSGVVTLADLKKRFAELMGGQGSFATGDDLISMPKLTKADLEKMDAEQLGRLMNQQEMKKPGVSDHWVTGRVGDIKQHPRYPYIFQRIVPVQYDATCGWHAMANAFLIADNHLNGRALSEVSGDDQRYLEETEMIDTDAIEATWNRLYYNRSRSRIPIPLAMINNDLLVMGSLAEEFLNSGYVGVVDYRIFLVNTIRTALEKPGRQAYVIVANTAARNGAHWYALTILKDGNGTLQFVFVDSAGETTENVGDGKVANVTHLREDNQTHVELYALINQMFHEKEPDKPSEYDRQARPAAAAAADDTTTFEPITFTYSEGDFSSKRIGDYGTISIPNFIVANPERASSKISYQFDSYNYEENNTVGFVIGSADQNGPTFFGLSAAYNIESSDSIDKMQAETVAKEWVKLLYQVRRAKNLDWHDHVLYREATNMLHDTIKAARDKDYSLLANVVATGTIGVLHNNKVTFAHVGDTKMVAYRGSQNHKVYQIIAENTQDLRPGKKIPVNRFFGSRSQATDPVPEIITVDVQKKDIIIMGSRNFWHSMPNDQGFSNLSKQDSLKGSISLANGEISFIKDLAQQVARESYSLYEKKERDKDAITVLGVKIK